MWEDRTWLRWKMIPKRDGSSDPLMYRFHILRTPWFRLALHKIVAPDGLEFGLHDHPWHFWSIVLRGGYLERYSTPSPLFQGPSSRYRAVGSFAYHPASYTHAIVSVDGPCYTFVVTSGRVAKWGFPEKGIVVG